MLKFLMVVALFAAVVYALAWSIERRRTMGAGNGPATPAPRRLRKPQPPPRQAAPDDDEDFLRWLDRKRRKGTGPDPDPGEGQPPA